MSFDVPQQKKTLLYQHSDLRPQGLAKPLRRNHTLVYIAPTREKQPSDPLEVGLEPTCKSTEPCNIWKDELPAGKTIDHAAIGTATTV